MMIIFKRLIARLNTWKEMNIWGSSEESLSEKEREDLDRVPVQNPYGMVGLVMSGAAFIFGPKYGFLPVMTLIFCVVTYFTFDKEKEDNPFPFYMGIILSLIGLSMFIAGEEHRLIV